MNRTIVGLLVLMTSCGPPPYDPGELECVTITPEEVDCGGVTFDYCGTDYYVFEDGTQFDCRVNSCAEAYEQALDHCAIEVLPVDDDNDGVSVEDGDCDDADATTYPGADELCDGVDNDCDETIDNDPVDVVDLYLDDDGDGFGAGTATTGCDDTDGYVTNGDDCDDANANVSPDGEETCNDIDDDCSGEVDDDAKDASTWYADSDSDGYGDDASAELACEPPTSTHTDIGGDCDDTSIEVYPDAQELCDSVDNDCDGDVDETQPTWYFDNDGDGYGDIGLSQTGCSQPGTSWVTNADDCDDDDASVNPDARETSGDGIDNDCDGVVE